MTKRQRQAWVALALFVAGAILGYSVNRTAGFFVALAGVAIIVFGLAFGRDAPPSDGASKRSLADRELLTAEEVAAKLGVRADWVYTLVARDGIPYVRHGGRWWAPELRFRWSEIEAWVQREGGEMLQKQEQDAHADS